ncbi:MAG TPA: serine hydrolase domain-containing protein [Anaerolineales bacterium]|nr:serine hydrolase domain-containing protein [Anaerolineales bacterium]
MQEEVDHLAHTVINGFGVAGMAIGIIKGEQVYAKGYGVKSIETQEPVTADSLFHLASISKTFVASAVVQLAEQGKLELDAPVLTYLPDFILDDERYRQITVRQMLSHTAGMPDTDDYCWDRPEYDDQALERYVRSLAPEKLIASPGEKFAYSNIGYEVLGLLIARTSGQSFEDYIKQHLLLPLGMNSSTFLKTEVAPEHATSPHILLPPAVVSSEYPYNRAHAPSSTLHSSAAELCSWALMNLNRGELQGRHILQGTSFKQLWHPYRQTGTNYPDEFVGLSWFIDTYRGHRRIRHDGVDTGFQSDMVILPDQSIAVVALANTIPAPMNMIMNAIVDLLLGLEPSIPKPPVLSSLGVVLSEHGIQGAADRYRCLQETGADQYDFCLEQFLDIGYTLLEVRRYPECFRVLQLGLELFPDAPEIADLLTQLKSRVGKA